MEKSMKLHATHEKTIKVLPGMAMLLLYLAMFIGTGFLWYLVIRNGISLKPGQLINFWLLGTAILASLSLIIYPCGFFALQPNEAKALIFFGQYVGTERVSGFHWTNPFNSKVHVSLRARNFNTPKLKVNDRRGSPIEIGAVVVWRVLDTAQVLFDIQNYEEFVSVQSESAVREMASRYAYDDGEEGEVTLRSGMTNVADALCKELQERLANAGVFVEESRLVHLAYAPEIAQAMLRRQQAEAIIAARQKIVHGAVSMVEMALSELSDRNIVRLDDERRAAMVSNLLVVLCSESETQPVVNTGTLYN
jgi:regulator of protease activity HflC (stomatin/prohibitin superfamily)